MKKTLSLIIAGILCLTALCGCADRSGPSDESVEAPSVELSYDEESYFVPGETSKPSESRGDESGEESAVSPSETSQPSDDSKPSEISQPTETSQPSEQQTGRFVVKVAKYDYNNYAEKKLGNICEGGPYKDVSIAILDITNETDKHYSVTIKGSYLDKDGKVLKTETQEWDQFASGWQKYFLFRPGMAFDKFEYTIETKEFKGDCWKTKLSRTFLNLQKTNRMGHPALSCKGNGIVWVEALEANIRYKDDVSKQYSHGMRYLVLFDESGQVIGIYQRGRTDFARPMNGDGLEFQIYFADPDEGGKFDEWPEMFRGNLTGIIVETWIDEVGKLEEHLK